MCPVRARALHTGRLLVARSSYESDRRLYGANSRPNRSEYPTQNKSDHRPCCSTTKQQQKQLFSCWRLLLVGFESELAALLIGRADVRLIPAGSARRARPVNVAPAREDVHAVALSQGRPPQLR